MADTGDRRGRVPRIRLIRNLSLALCAIIAAGLVAFWSGHQTARPTPPHSYGAPGLAIGSAASGFAPLDQRNQIPPDVLSALPVPAKATVVRRVNHDRNLDTYDRSVTYATPASVSAVRQFFPAALARRHWSVMRATTPILARHSGTDGYYWEMGVTVSPAAKGSRFTLTLMLYQGEI